MQVIYKTDCTIGNPFCNYVAKCNKLTEVRLNFTVLGETIGKDVRMSENINTRLFDRILTQNIKVVTKCNFFPNPFFVISGWQKTWGKQKLRFYSQTMKKMWRKNRFITICKFITKRVALYATRFIITLQNVINLLKFVDTSYLCRFRLLSK